MPECASWTLDELVGRVAAALESPTYPGAPNGRVRELPDRRIVRWYTTTGLVDRPVMQGRTARYSPRHLQQIVAVKRRQAQGRSLAEIQDELAG
ncbi:MerR family transcriptional regulator, partial [Mycobacterium simiae]